MSDPSTPRGRPHSSRQRYRQFVEDYRQHRLDELNEDQRRLALAVAGLQMIEPLFLRSIVDRSCSTRIWTTRRGFCD